MNKLKLMFVCSFTACLMLQSCENETRLNEIKKELGSFKTTGVTNDEVREKVVLNAPSLNKPAPPPVEDFGYDGYYGDGGYYGGYNYDYDVPSYDYYNGEGY